MNEVYVIKIEDGNEYKLQFTTDHSGLIAPELLDFINSQGIEVVEVGLGRSKGSAVTNPRVLAKVEEYIAEMFLSHSNVVISFFCDFINFIPSMSKRRKDINNKVVVIQGVAES